MSMNLINKELFFKLIIIFFSILFFFILDFLVGKIFFNHHSEFQTITTECKYRIKHNLYHHTLKSNFSGHGIWGKYKYNICTDKNGFKISCQEYVQKNNDNEYDIWFIGDSFTEAVGLEYEDSFVGIFDQSNPNLKIANLGVVSYSPSVYFNKIRYLIENIGLKTKHVIAYIDISDIQDEAVKYSATADFCSSQKMKSSNRSFYSGLKALIKDHFPLTLTAAMLIRNSIYGEPALHLEYEYERGGWTYNPNANGYGELGINGGIERSLLYMNKLYNLLSEKNIKLSIGVYPWPGQLIHDNANSRQVEIWKDFCIGKCEYFIDNFNIFFKHVDKTSSKNTIEKFYMDRDVHFNKEGNRLLAEQLLSQIKF